MPSRIQLQLPFWVTWTVLDSVGIVLAWRIHPGGAFVAHLAIVGAGVAWSRSRFVCPEDRGGWKTALWFGSGFAALNPVVGPALAGWLWRWRPAPVAEAAGGEGWIAGNRLFPKDDFLVNQGDVFDAPLVASLDQARGGRLGGQVHRICRDGSRPVIDLLRRLMRLGDCRTQLLASAAVGLLREEGESRLKRLRSLWLAHPEDGRSCLWLAAALTANARSGVAGAEASRLQWEEAARLYATMHLECPGDAEALGGWADCLLQLDRLEDASRVIRRLLEMPGAIETGKLMEGRWFCQNGSWKDVAAGIAEVVEAGASDWLPRGSREFWLSSPPSRPRKSR